MTHPSARELRLLADLALDRKELSRLAWHLYGCAPCRSRLQETSERGAELLELLFREVRPLADEVDGEPGYRSAFDAARRRAVARSAVAEAERAAARAAVPQWIALDRDARRERLLADPRLHSWPMVEELLETYLGVSRDDPAEAEHWVRLAQEAVDALRRRADAFRPSDELVSDLEARVLASLGHCLRVQSRLREADRAIAEAERCLERGTGDPIEAGAVLESRASLRRAQRRFREALTLTERAGRLYRRLGDTARLARTLISRATLESHLHRRRQAIDTLRQALASLDRAAEPDLWMSATYNLATALHEAGRSAEAAETLEEVRPQLESSAGVSDRARLRWFEGHVAAGAGDAARAERNLREACDVFVRLEMAYEVALVSLDLAALYLEQARTAETRRLADSMLPFFRSREIHREATAALLLFHRAALAETATASLAAEVAATVRRGRARGPRPADEPPS